uniref:Uncharacterized protein n=1 Tax=Candidatus Methanogaster sp. ANME-2c ERB4 TaxID=2759911 RepID=A0A7G9YA41_9EURY|nr:hypothetical protein MEJPCEBH_00001 [Methanosarcinales archaeon ANME-2c ERB4]
MVEGLRSEEPVPYSLFRERIHEINPELLILRADHPEHDLDSFLVNPLLLVFRRISADDEVLSRWYRSIDLLRVDDDACIERNDRFIVHVDRVDIHLDDFWEVYEHVRYFNKRLLDKKDVRRRFIAKSLQETIDFGILDHASCKNLIQWRKAECQIPEQFDSGSARSKEDRRTE